MVRPVHFGWVWERWPAFLAGLCCVLFITPASPVRTVRDFGSELALVEAAARASGRIVVHVTSSPDPCVGADAGPCSQSGEVGVRPDAGRVGTKVAPLSGARVRVFSARDGHYLPWVEVSTDSAGNAQFDAPAGVYWLLIDAPARARSAERLVLDGTPQYVRVELPFARPLQINVRDHRGQAIADATVLVQASDPLPHGALTSAEGVASFTSVGQRIESVRVHARGYDSALVEPTSRDLVVQLSTPAVLTVSTVDAAGKGVSQAEVWLAGVDFWPPRQVHSGADGVAVLSGLSHGTYDLRARHGDRVSPVFVATVERGERRQVTLQLEAGRSIPVRVTDGHAEDASPVAGADVVLVEDGLSPFPLQGRTGPDGRVLLGPLPAGNAALNVRADGFVPESSVPVPGSVTAEIRIALLRGGRLLGQVLDTDGTPVEGARLEVVGNDLRGRPIARHSGSLNVPRGFFERSLGTPLPLVPMGELGVMTGPLPSPGMSPVGPAPNAAWTSDLDGNYRLDDVPPGRLQLLVRHPEFVEALSSAVTLAPGGEAHVRVVLERGAALEGRLVDERGQPVQGARIEALAPHATQQRTVLTSADGRFAFGAVSPEVDLFVSRPEDRYRFVLRRGLELEAGETRELELVLPAERPLAVVLVTTEDARPIADAQVSVMSVEPDIPLRQTSYSDASGQSQVSDAVGIHAILRVQAAGYRSFEVELEQVPSRINVTLERGVTVTGRITQVRGRQGVPGAEVAMVQDGERRSTFSDAEGEFQFVDVAPGAARVSVSHPEFSSLESDVEIASTGRADRAFELEPFDLQEAGSVSGTVVDSAGAPVRGARVGVGFVPAFLPVGKPPPRSLVLTDTAGRFELRGVEVGRVTLSAYAAGLGRGRLADVDVVAGESASGLQIELDGGHSDPELGALANVAITLGERDRDQHTEVVIVDVAPGSEAERAGLRVGDVLWSVDGVLLEEMSDVRRRLGGSDGSDVIIEVERDGEPVSARVRREPVK